MRETTCVANNECPPISKKLSSLPIRSRFNTSSKIPATISSTGVCGAAISCSDRPLHCDGIGSLFRSIFPLIVTGISSSTWIVSGVIYSGSLSRRCLFSSADVTSATPTTYPTRRLSPGLSSLTTTTLCFTASCFSSAASISPGSIRYPLTLTCPSLLPPNSISPSATYFPTSPVPYLLPPTSRLYPSGLYLSALIPGLFRHPLVTPRPTIHSSPFTPTGANSPSSSQIQIPPFHSGRPIRFLAPTSLPLSVRLAQMIVPSVGPYSASIRAPSKTSPSSLSTSAGPESPPTNTFSIFR